MTRFEPLDNMDEDVGKYSTYTFCAHRNPSPTSEIENHSKLTHRQLTFSHNIGCLGCSYLYEGKLTIDYR